MKIAVLTTDTLHHAYFVREVVRFFPIEVVLVETASLAPSFEISHPFEDQRTDYELRKIFNNKRPGVGHFADTKEFPDVNSASAARLLKDIAPDVIVVFGTSKISPNIIAVCPKGIVNLHGGDPEKYRGLDSHLWAIYHNDFNSLVTTLHRLNKDLDDGEIILQAPIELYTKMPLHALRRYNTDVCIKLVLSALDMFVRYDTFISRKQRRKGRYYSFMPAVLKSICKRKFERFTGQL